MSDLTTKDIVKKYGFRFTKSLGQNFLIDESVLMDIVDGAEVNAEDFVIEIGPGVGTLTKELLKRAKRVCAIELDSDLIPILKEELKDFDNFDIVNVDALKVDFKELIGEEKSVKVVANLPYYVTTPIIVKLLNEEYNFKSLTIMIQKEVGERMAAKPNTKEYGALSILVQYHCNTKIIRKVSPSSFIPQPKVESIVVKMDKLLQPRVQVKDKKLYFRVSRESFNARRKTLWNAMKNLKLNSEIIEAAFIKSGIDSKRRGETLSLEEFGDLANAIYELSK
jgi:16S rRNA (adenine1518-N6/adenine1519-N6)-dimethyltransferase